ncbi:MAG: succinate dehydrogenase cytochrome b subunit [Gemmatimonadota bacterium]|nr:succinate dehydrogenase cytochrome b subunit [Gemmatimonadota bacterium]MDH4349925.1 succinate dehydrogenase cytochrome b subunit [Gemmatimonadota bacterium]MDH5196012.1 succinate dehydrogenase cytochrome b subunit [Gemmatimonadota bacterium]
MARVSAFYRSTVGKKVLMAITGFVLLGFVVVHMIGNLKAFMGAEYFNTYAEALRALGAPFFGHGQALWLFRIVLLGSVLIHAFFGIQLWLVSNRARPIGYEKTPYLQTTAASLTMRWGGLLIGGYVVYHLMHLTIGNVNPDFIPGDAYHNLVVGFESTTAAAAYVIAVFVLALHLYHGTWSALQTLGLNHPKYNSWRRGIAAVLAIVLLVGFATVPVAVQLGVLK